MILRKKTFKYTWGNSKIYSIRYIMKEGFQKKPKNI